MNSNTNIQIDTALVQRLINSQFPQWAHLVITPVKTSGWDNRTFHLGNTMTIRLPSKKEYALAVEKEQYWLPKLAPHLPLVIPTPIAMGEPSIDYPWPWSIYQWIEGESAATATILDSVDFAERLATFLRALEQCDTTDAPHAGAENFFRGGDLSIYDAQTRQVLAKLDDQNQASKLLHIWEKALASKWNKNPVWIHGDVAVSNLIVANEQLHAIIDFGQLAIGDPACDLALYWTLFIDESRNKFRETMSLDQDTWDRGCGWVLWKTLCAPVSGTDCDSILNTLINWASYE